MSNRRLDASYVGLKAQLGAHGYAKTAALRATATSDLLSQLGLADLVGVITKDRRKAILERFEAVGRQIRNQGIIDLVSAFEADLFQKLRMATSHSRHVLDEHYPERYPFAAQRSELARTVDDFANLGGYRRLLAKPSESQADPRSDLWDVIAQRDRLAHGERWDLPAAPPTIDSAYKTLSQELDRVQPPPR